MPAAAGPWPESTTGLCASLVEVTTVTGASCRRPSLCLRPSYHAGRGRAGADDRNRDEIELMELVKQRLLHILRPRHHAGRGRTVAGVHHRAVCESGGGDDGYWSLLSASEPMPSTS